MDYTYSFSRVLNSILYIANIYIYYIWIVYMHIYIYIWYTYNKNPFLLHMIYIYIVCIKNVIHLIDFIDLKFLVILWISDRRTLKTEQENNDVEHKTVYP